MIFAWQQTLGSHLLTAVLSLKALLRTMDSMKQPSQSLESTYEAAQEVCCLLQLAGRSEEATTIQHIKQALRQLTPDNRAAPDLSAQLSARDLVQPVQGLMNWLQEAGSRLTAPQVIVAIEVLWLLRDCWCMSAVVLVHECSVAGA